MTAETKKNLTLFGVIVGALVVAAIVTTPIIHFGNKMLGTTAPMPSTGGSVASTDASTPS